MESFLCIAKKITEPYFITMIDYYANSDNKLKTKTKTKITTLKFEILDKILNNSFFSNEMKEKAFLSFCSVQKINNSFSRISYLYKNRKAPIKISTDMFLSPIKETDKNIISIYDAENSCKYLFTISDLIQIIKKSLIHSPNFFSDPLECKNPYTNIPFNKSTLYNIYFYMKHKNYSIPDVIQNFFIENFDLKNFKKNNLYSIREHAIKDYVENLQPEHAEEYIIFMLKSIRKKKIRIDKDFPKNRLKEIMKPYLCYHFLANNSMCFEKRRFYFQELYKKIKKFFKFNPNFGRKYIKFEKTTLLNLSQNPFSTNIKKYKKVIIFDDKHINFYENEDEHFFTSHLKNPSVYESESEGEGESEGESEGEDDDNEAVLINIIPENIVEAHLNEFDSESDSESESDSTRNQAIQAEIFLFNQQYGDGESGDNDSVS